VYDNAQAVYLILLIRKFHKKNGMSRKDIVISKLKKAVTINASVAFLDWVTILMFLAQILFFSNTTKAFSIQQAAGANTGIHAALIVVVFQNLRNLTFPEPKKSHVPMLLKHPMETINGNEKVETAQ
jgi:hypothetical protein